MKKFKKFIKSPASTISLFAVAAVLLAFSSIGGARAALTYFSETYSSRVQMYDIGVSLLENGERVSWRDYNSDADGTWDEAAGELFGNLTQEDEQLQLGRSYPEELTISNSGSIGQYVRVTIYKYWEDADGKKLQNLSPDLIGLDLTADGSDWIIDDASSTAERTVLYYRHLLGSGETTEPFADTLQIDGMLATKVTQTTEAVDGGTKITTAYDYDGVRFNIEVVVDVVQEHNAADAILSAWGRAVSVSDGTLSLQ